MTTPVPLVGAWRSVLCALIVACGVLLGTSPVAAAQSSAAESRPAPAGGAEPPSRLDVAAAALRRGPLYLDAELSWMLDADTARSLRRDLEDARVPVLVAFLPSLTEDESGGDSRRVLRALQQKTGRDAVFVTADQNGYMDVASVGVPLDLMIPMSLMLPPRDERSFDARVEDPGPPGWTSVPQRLRRVLRHVRVAKSGTPNGIVDDVRPLPTLSGHHGPANSSEDIVALGIVGLVLGLVSSGMILGGRRTARRRREARAVRAAARRTRPNRPRRRRRA